jgi:hypothetical protein
MRRMRKQPIGHANPRNFRLMPGDRVWRQDHTTGEYHMLDLRESRGRDKAAAGELTPVVVKKNGRPRVACVWCGLWFWLD